MPRPALRCHPGGAGSIPAEPAASPGTFRCHTAHRTTINPSAGRCVGGCPLAAQPLLQVSPFFSLVHPAISPAPAAGARRALSRSRRHRGMFHPVNGFPVMFNHHQRWRRCSPLALLPHRTLHREPACLLGNADTFIRGCQYDLLAWCWPAIKGDGHGDPSLGQVGDGQCGSRPALPPGTCWTWTPSLSPTQVSGGAGQGARHGTEHGTAAWLCSSLRSGGPLCAGLGEQRVEGGERGPLSWLIPGWVKWAHMATRVHGNDPSPSTVMIRPRQQR